MSAIPLTYLPKRYNVVPFTNHKNMTGGQMTRVDTFLTCKGNDAKLVLDHCIDNLLHIPVVVKIMLDDPFGRAEVRNQQFFKQHPHRNIVKGLYEFKYHRCPIEWNIGCTNTKHVHCWYCDVNTHIVIVQKYIHGGDLFGIKDVLSYSQWKSVFLQTLFAELELFDKYGFTYDNLKSSNIIIDKTSDIKVSYNAFDREWIVSDTYGLSPVFTDFSKSGIDEKKLEYLLESIGLCVNMFGFICKSSDIKKYCIQYIIRIKEVTSLTDAINIVNELIVELDKY